MKGLLLKDAYVISKICRSILLIDVVFIIVSLYASDNIYFIFFPCLFTGIMPFTLISYDERERWDIYTGTMPYTRGQIVSSKYLVGLIGSVIIIAVIAALHIFKMSAAGVNAQSCIFMAELMLIASLAAPTLLLPLVFKFGAEKGRIFYYIIICAACVLCNSFIEIDKIDTSILSRLDSVGAMAIIFAATVMLYLSSWALSVFFYKRREL